MVKRPIVLVLGLAATAIAVLRRRKVAADATVWRDATSDTSR